MWVISLCAYPTVFSPHFMDTAGVGFKDLVYILNSFSVASIATLASLARSRPTIYETRREAVFPYVVIGVNGKHLVYDSVILCRNVDGNIQHGRTCDDN